MFHSQLMKINTFNTQTFYKHGNDQNLFWDIVNTQMSLTMRYPGNKQTLQILVAKGRAYSINLSPTLYDRKRNTSRVMGAQIK
jgi:hypothetical protein